MVMDFGPFLANLTTRPGVYSMMDDSGKVLYVGKAKNLKKRVSSYFHRQLDTKTQQLVKQIHSIEVTVTRNEREALLLESNLIKELKPRYNIIFRDDKSYPYLFLSKEDPKENQFPRLGFYRGDKGEKGNYFGPYPSSRSAREALTLLQGIFRLRQCDNAFFKSRKRPCLQYQIKRCTAPCVGNISEEDYDIDVRHAKLFLEGKSQAVIHMLIERMDVASQSLEYEMAARIRDQIARLRGIQEQQIIMNTKGDVDVLGMAYGRGEACIQMLSIREGNILGSRQYFPEIPKINFNGFSNGKGDGHSHGKSNGKSDADTNEASAWLKAFILQHYLGASGLLASEIPKEILVPMEIPDRELLNQLLTEKKGEGVQINQGKRGDRLKWIEMATESAKHAFELKINASQDLSQHFEALQDLLKIDSIPERLECFDVSHSLGESTVASCVVFDTHGPVKSDYRRFNIKVETPGDDIKALSSALTRRYTRLKSESKMLPDLLIIDGGKGQVNAARQVLTELQVTGLLILGIAKGPARKAGLETLFLSTNGNNHGTNHGTNHGSSITNRKGALKIFEGLDPSNPGFHLIQRIRDEAHRFAITAHRKQRAKRRIHSILEEIPGVGKNRRLNLLRQFGGLQEVRQASIEELAKVPGISRQLAKKIYEALHGS